MRKTAATLPLHDTNRERTTRPSWVVGWRKVLTTLLVGIPVVIVINTNNSESHEKFDNRMNTLVAEDGFDGFDSSTYALKLGKCTLKYVDFEPELEIPWFGRAPIAPNDIESYKIPLGGDSSTVTVANAQELRDLGEPWSGC